ncbi:protein kinase [Frankia sp. Ag45/Mut15]|uniref:non-specific serine/threonine protein kinase n=1 Tax=Frankia umida TaxID=573489 RepID=A0ABT0K2A3_9ACTN|nr:serine/threonine-protein kinase [Frankia umida]MCK9877949.1 protein kinase [Frankia umida]
MAGESRSPAVLVGGRYQLAGVLGRGGFGVVHRATDELLRRPVAVKEVRLPVTENGTERDRARQRVLREARAAGRLHHPGAVSVLDVIDDGDLPWIVMEYVEGQSLARIISDLGARPIEQTCQIGITLAYALEAAHRLGIVHRDVKPSNVLITADGRARLTDFGIAVSHGDARLTNTGMVLGSPAYLPPERARGGTGNAAGDRWGLGAALFATVEGCPPYGGGDPVAVVSAVMRGDRRPFRLAGPLAPLIDDLMSPHETSRPPLSAVRRRLRDILQSFGDAAGGRGGSRSARAHRPGPPPAPASDPDPSAFGAAPAAAAAITPALTRPTSTPTPTGDTTAVDGPRPSEPEATMPGTRTVAATIDTTTTVGSTVADADTDAGAETTIARHDDAHPDQPAEPAATVLIAPPHGDQTVAVDPAVEASSADDLDHPADNPAEVALPVTVENPPVTPEAADDPGPVGLSETDHSTTVATVATVATAATVATMALMAGNTIPRSGGGDAHTEPRDPRPSATPAPPSATSTAPATPPQSGLPIRGALSPRRAPDSARVRPTLPAAARARIARPVERLRQVDRTRALGGIPARARLINRDTDDRATPGSPAPADLAETVTPAPPAPPITPAPPAPHSPQPPAQPQPPAAGGAGTDTSAAAVAPDPVVQSAATRSLRAVGATRGPGRIRPLVLVSVLAVFAAVAAVAVLLLISRDDTHTSNTQGNRPIAQNTDSGTRAATVNDPLATSSVVAIPPPGWASYTDQAAGWSLAYPAGWRSQPGPGGAGNVDFMDPATGSFLRVGSVREANTSAIGDWRRIEASFVRSVQDYRRIRLTPSDGGDGTNQADWEFAYRRSDGVMVHVLNRGAIRNRHGYALYWHTPEDLWLQDQSLMASLFETFRPGP